MGQILARLDGKKTYVVALCIGLATVAYVLGYIDQAMWEKIAGLLGVGALLTVRQAIAKLSAQKPN